jgi:hypothetical protein
MDLRDYYDIKRPTVVFFNYNNPSGKKSRSNMNSSTNEEKKRQVMKVIRYDILSETHNESVIKMVNFN